MTARILRFFVIGLGAASAAWLLAWWNRSPAVAALGAVGILFAYSAVLLLEFAALAITHGSDPTPRATVAQLLRAWWAESVIGLCVFGWQQPFRHARLPDTLTPRARQGIVFVHGFFCNRGFWNPWLQRARDEQRPAIAVDLEPTFGSIDNYADTIERAVERLTAATGRAPLLVCHSMGGLAARAWLRRYRGHARVSRIVTIGTPHGGTWLGRFGRAANARQMRLDSAWVRAMREGEAATGSASFLCWYSNCDNIVFPPATAALPGADNRLVAGAAHVELAFRPEVMDATFAAADSDRSQNVRTLST